MHEIGGTVYFKFSGGVVRAEVTRINQVSVTIEVKWVTGSADSFQRKLGDKLIQGQVKGFNEAYRMYEIPKSLYDDMKADILTGIEWRNLIQGKPVPTLEQKRKMLEVLRV